MRCQSYNIHCNIQVVVEVFSIQYVCYALCIMHCAECTVHNTQAQQD